MDALRLLDELQLLPTLVSDSITSLPEAAQKFSRLSLTILRVMDDVMLCAMENFRALRSQVRAQGTAQRASREDQVQEIKRRASSLVSFAGLVKNKLQRADTASRIARMEVMIV